MQTTLKENIHRKRKVIESIEIIFFVKFIKIISFNKNFFAQQKQQTDSKATEIEQKNIAVFVLLFDSEIMSDLHLTESMYPPGWDVKYDSKTGKW